MDPVTLKAAKKYADKDLIPGKNKFNKLAATLGKFVSPTTGALSSNSAYDVSDWIPVKPNTQYAFKRSVNYRIAYYDSNKTFLSGTYPAVSPATTPANAAYVRFSLDHIYLDSQQFEEGAVETAYEAYKLVIPKSKLENSFSVSDVPDDALTPEKMSFVDLGANLLDKSKVTSGYYIQNTTGNLIANASYCVSDYIPVEPNTQYVRSYEHTVAFFTASKTCTGSGVASGVSGPFTTPANCAFIRVTVAIASLDTAQVEKGTVATVYKPYGYELKGFPRLDALRGDILLFLPSEICIAVGRTIELYNKQVAWCGNINNFHFKWSCDIGKAMKRKWTCTAVAEKIGNHTLTCKVYDHNMNIVAQASTTVKIVAATISTPITLTTIGDSLTNGKAWLGELTTLSSGKITYAGTRTYGVPAGQGHEGRSGATAAWYLADSTYSFDAYGVDTKNPFWNPATSQFDYNYYKSHYSISPTAIQIFLGTNSIALDPTVNATNIKGIVDGIRASDATIPIYVVFTLYRGNQDGIGNQLSTDGYSAGSGIWKLEEDRKVYNLMVKVYELLNAYTKLYFVPISLCHDSEYNFGAVATAVNPRATQTEPIPTEATHPQEQGYLQMADIMFSTIAAHYGE